MEKFSIADLIVEMDARGDLLFNRTRAYLYDGKESADITIDLSDDFFMSRSDRFPMLTLDECRYVWMGEAFYLNLLDHNGFMLHSSCIEYKGNAYLFSARSGTGKSTHTHIWLDEFKGSKIINDDKPAIRCTGGKCYAYGTPFSGKNDESINDKAPVRAIVFIERAKENSIKKIEAIEAIPLFMSQTIRPKTAKYMGIMLELLDSLFKTVPVFLLKCNMDKSAAHVSYEGIEKYYSERKKDED